MYNLLIVDDELTIRNGLIHTIDWKALGISVAGDVRHGAEALEFVKNNSVHIVITDLRMPIMDGMELTENLHALYPDIKIVILSGHEDFEIARKAIKNNVQDYLLKPFSLNKLENLMVSLCKDLDKMYRNREESRINDQLLSNTLFDLRNSLFIQTYCKTSLKEDDIKSIEKLGLPTNPSLYYIAVCEFENNIDTDIEELIRISRLLDEKYKVNKEVIPFINIKNQIVVYLNKDFSPESLLLEINNIYDKCVYIGVGSVINEWNDLKKSYNEALLTYKARPFMGFSSILEYENLPDVYKLESNSIKSLTAETDTIIIELSDYIIKSNLSKSLECLGKLSANFSKSFLDFKIYKQELVKVIVISAYYLKRHGVDIEEKLNTYSTLLDSTSELHNIQEVERWSRQIVNNLCNKVNLNNKVTCKPLVKKALCYMENNYKTQLRIDEVADHLLITPNYLSRILKEETGLSFLNWLNQYRVKQSEKLLSDPTMKIYEISDMVGFTDYRYFNKVFKKFKKISPREFRNNSLV